MSQTPEQKAAAEATRKEALLKELAGLNITATSGTETITPLKGDEDNATLAKLLKQAKAEAKAAAAPKTDPNAPITVKHRDHEGKV